VQAIRQCKLFSNICFHRLLAVLQEATLHTTTYVDVIAARVCSRQCVGNVRTACARQQAATGKQHHKLCRRTLCS
jgi:hypothetical protein